MIKRLISYYWVIRYTFQKWLWDRSTNNSVINGCALMYHHVTDEDVAINDSCKCTIQEFKSVLLQFKNEGRILISVDGMLEIINNKRPVKFAVVTFDDVPDNFYTNAYPFLKNNEIPFILFITTDFIGKKGYLSMDQMIELDKDPLCTIGAHTLTHPMLRRVKNSKEELVESKRILEEILGHQVNYLAYPFGRPSSVSKRIMKEAKQAGYLCAFGTIQSFLTDKSSNHRYYLPRIVKKSIN